MDEVIDGVAPRTFPAIGGKQGIDDRGWIERCPAERNGTPIGQDRKEQIVGHDDQAEGGIIVIEWSGCANR
jgi:hypothetical protein